ncbi:hypothetical protein BRYFOR_05467 [Marvinbryantia formatexigens DSM 14469]|uniref:Uncharacterized protein n=1 Tax=Marvinbryantia formatexigens DSM 14469 TaxID=478749 RepID=C6LA25_9FIRM|nr:hypothetical protein [Marvinbryantia formatexigens]EET62432.1 hypothetical protein BRYFOR_05467 [Marvinbryantia formatexigens DSM 14469]UWO25028.1 hypothetical protein NQ534_00585 [Marvinbryantia formatexigens DSM 14469]SDG27963.1 hypothetical protein SAMN05660368_02259 [Marvinbryantia formatexigens]
MKDMEYLDEKDLEYWKKKEQEGEAVIIYLNPERLLSLDIRELLPERNRNPPDGAEVYEWLRENKLVDGQHDKKADSIRKENECLRRQEKGEDVGEILADWLKRTDLDEERIAVVEEAIRQGVEKELLLFMIREDLETAQVKDIISALGLFDD